MHEHDELLEDLLIHGGTSLPTEIAVANDLALHPYHQKVLDRPQDYVTIDRETWNRIVTLAGQQYQAQWNEKVKQAAMGEKKYICRYDCGEAFTNSSNRNRHERKQHGKENGHES